MVYAKELGRDRPLESWGRHVPIFSQPEQLPGLTKPVSCKIRDPRDLAAQGNPIIISIEGGENRSTLSGLLFVYHQNPKEGVTCAKRFLPSA